MALNKAQLELAIVALMTSMLSKEENSISEFASGLSSAIDNYVKSGTVNVNVSTTVSTVGTALAQTGTGVGTGVGNIN